jgi:hypothetical protein
LPKFRKGWKHFLGIWSLRRTNAPCWPVAICDIFIIFLMHKY